MSIKEIRSNKIQPLEIRPVKIDTSQTEVTKDRVEFGHVDHEQAGVKKKWLVLNYIAADCNLQASQVKQIDNIEEIGSDDNTHIVAQIDRGTKPEGTKPLWEGSRRYYVTKDSKLFSSKLHSDLLQEQGQINMSLPETLRDFVAWGMTNFPAEHVIVVLNGHGGGPFGVITDDSHGGMMSVPGLTRALKEAEDIAKQKVDIVAFDACLMASSEVGYEMRDNANILLASEETIGGQGLDYRPMLDEKIKEGLKILQSDTRITVTPQQLSEKIVEVNANNPMTVPTYSAVDLKRMTAVKEATNKLGELILRSDPNQQWSIKNAIASSQSFYLSYLKDHKSMAVNILNALEGGRIQDPDGKLEEACLEVVDSIQGNPDKGIDAAVFMSEHRRDYPGATGLSVLADSGQKALTSKYQNLAWAKDSKWDEAMSLLFSDRSAEQSPKTFSDGSPLPEHIND